jgi:hypothetical protein
VAYLDFLFISVRRRSLFGEECLNRTHDKTQTFPRNDTLVERDPMRVKKKLLIIGVLTLFLAGLALLFLRWRSNQLSTTSLTGAPDGSFVLQIEKPLLSLRAPWEVPRAVFGDRDPDLRLRQTSPGAKLGVVTPKRFELTADGGWDLVIESDGQGKILETTQMAFPMKISERYYKFRCRHADSGVGYFNTTTREDKLDGTFLLRLTQCKNVLSGKNTAGLPPFPVRGSFKGLPQSTTVKDEGETKK